LTDLMPDIASFDSTCVMVIARLWPSTRLTEDDTSEMGTLYTVSAASANDCEWTSY